MIKLQQAELRGKRVLVRADLNVAVQDGDIKSKARIRASLDTVKYVLDANASVLIVSHFGRPQEGRWEQQYSLAPVTQILEEMLNRKVLFVRDWIDGVAIEPGQVALCENVRFLEGESSCSRSLSRRMAKLCDVYVMDAFGSAHRDHASLTGIVEFVPVACAGLLSQHEIDSLDKALESPDTPVVSIVGGAKIDGKLQALRRLCRTSQTLIVGGGIANTFLAATGHSVGRSLYEPALVPEAIEILNEASRNDCDIPLPKDVIVAPSLDGTQQVSEKDIQQVGELDMILDIGSTTRERYRSIIEHSGTIIWNGPVGVYETIPFDAGTRVVGQAVASSTAFSVAGGGDTLAALEQFGILEQISYVSTGGGAFLEYVQGNALYAIAALERHAERHTNAQAIAY